MNIWWITVIFDCSSDEVSHHSAKTYFQQEPPFDHLNICYRFLIVTIKSVSSIFATFSSTPKGSEQHEIRLYDYQPWSIHVPTRSTRSTKHIKPCVCVYTSKTNMYHPNQQPFQKGAKKYLFPRGPFEDQQFLGGFVILRALTWPIGRCVPSTISMVCPSGP